MINRTPTDLSTMSRRYFLAGVLVALTAAYFYDKTTDQMGQLLLGATALTCLAGSVQMLRLASQADKTTRLNRVEQIRRQYDIVPWFPEYNPTIHQVNRTLREIQERERQR